MSGEVEQRSVAAWAAGEAHGSSFGTLTCRTMRSLYVSCRSSLRLSSTELELPCADAMCGEFKEGTFTSVNGRTQRATEHSRWACQSAELNLDRVTSLQYAFYYSNRVPSRMECESLRVLPSHSAASWARRKKKGEAHRVASRKECGSSHSIHFSSAASLAERKTKGSWRVWTCPRTV